jgi:hypothetical protein
MIRADKVAEVWRQLHGRMSARPMLLLLLTCALPLTPRNTSCSFPDFSVF